MGLALVTAPAAEPVSLAEARAHCRVSSNDEDGLLTGYLVAARQYVEAITARACVSQTFDQTHDFYWPCLYPDDRPGIELQRTPVSSVTSISYVDTAGATQVLASNQYRLVTGETICRVEPAYGVCWPSVRYQAAAITVRFAAGYGANLGDTPEPIRHAILLLTGHFFENREPVNVGNITSPLPLSVDALLAPYRVYF